MSIYTPDETDQYDPPPCPLCGGPTVVNWVAVPVAGRPPGSMLTPGTYWCAVDCAADGPLVERVAEHDQAFMRSFGWKGGDVGSRWETFAVWLLWDGSDEYGPDLIDVYAAEAAALAAREQLYRREADRDAAQPPVHPALVGTYRVLGTRPPTTEEWQRKIAARLSDRLAYDPYSDFGRYYIERREPKGPSTVHREFTGGAFGRP